MNLTVKEFGITELTARLQTRMKIPEFMAHFLVSLGGDIAASVRDKTPQVSDNLAGSIQQGVYEDLVIISTQVAYAPFIEAGARNDPRVGVTSMARDTHGRYHHAQREVRRKAGAELMFYRTAQEFKAMASTRVQELWNSIASVWMG